MRISDWSSDVCSSDLVVVAAAANVLDHVHHLVGAVGIVSGKPGAEERRDFERQAHQYVGGADRTGLGGGRHDRLDFVIGDRGDDRRDIDLRRHPGVDQLGDRSEEHTSELQSLMRISYAVFCLKKKIQQDYNQLMVSNVQRAKI